MDFFIILVVIGGGAVAGVGQAFLRAIVPLDSCRSLGEF